MPDVTFLSDAPLTLAAGTDGAPPMSRIEVAMLGSFKDPRYGAFSISPEMVDAWKARLADHFHGRVPIDLDHRTDKGFSSEAAGWITSLEIVGDRVVANVEWTPLGEAAVAEKRYLYISPTFVDNLTDIKGTKLGPALLRAALTNSPALNELAAVSLSAAPMFAERVEDEPYELADFTQHQRDELAAKGHALPDGSFPIRNKADLENAVKAYGRAKDKAAAKRHIVKRAADLGATDMLPEGWDTATLDAPVPICVGDRVAESFDDLSLGKHGVAVRVYGREDDGVIVHDVTWDDGTRSLAIPGLSLRCLSPYRSLSLVDVKPPEPAGPDLAKTLEQLADLARQLRPATA